MLVGPAGVILRDWKTNKVIYEKENIKFPRLRQNEYWVIGDNRSDSWHGVIYRHQIEGKAKD